MDILKIHSAPIAKHGEIGEITFLLENYPFTALNKELNLPPNFCSMFVRKVASRFQHVLECFCLHFHLEKRHFEGGYYFSPYLPNQYTKKIHGTGSIFSSAVSCRLK